MLRPSTLAAATLALSTLLFSACIFGKDEGSFTYTTEVHGLTRALHSYNPDGSVKGDLGVGIETVADHGLSEDGESVMVSGNAILVLPPYSPDDSAADADSGSALEDDGAILWDMIGYAAKKSAPPFVGIGRGATHYLGVDAGIIVPQIFVRGRRAGFPCKFSGARAHQVAANGDTVWLAVAGARLDRADTARVAVLLDEPSLLANDRFDSLKPVTGTVRVTCPGP